MKPYHTLIAGLLIGSLIMLPGTVLAQGGGSSAPGAPGGVADTLTLPPGAAQGKVTDPNGNPIPGARILIRDSNGTVVTEAVSAADGTVSFPASLAPGTYTVAAAGGGGELNLTIAAGAQPGLLTLILSGEDGGLFLLGGTTGKVLVGAAGLGTAIVLFFVIRNNSGGGGSNGGSGGSGVTQNSVSPN